MDYLFWFVHISVCYCSHLLLSNWWLRSILADSTLIESAPRGHLHGGSLIDGFLQLGVSLLLNRLGVLKFLDQFHFEHFHLHHFCLFLPYHLFFLRDLTCNFFSGGLVLLSTVLFNLCFLNSFLLFLELGFQFVLLGLLRHEVVVSLFVLLIDHLGLFGLLLLLQEHGVFYLLLFFVPLLL